MGKQIHLEKIERLFDKSSVVDLKSIERIVGVTKRSNYAKLIIFNLIKKGIIKRIGKGIYTKNPEISLAVFAFKPSYLGLQSALSHFGIWEQETIPVILTTKKVRTGIRNIMDANILVRTMNKKYFFGFEYIKEENFYLPYSNLEKTFIDMVVFNQKMSNEVIKEIKKRINKKRLNIYLKEYSPKFKKIIDKILLN